MLSKILHIRSTIVALLFGAAIWAQGSNEALFNKATDAYNSGKYEEAIDQYQQIIKNGEHSAALYFNLGNAHYKLNQIAPSIYYFEKARLLDPNDPEIKNNLGYARNMGLDAIETLPQTGLSRLYGTLTGIFTFEQGAYIAIASMIVFVLLYLAFYSLETARFKRMSFILSLIFLFVSLASIALAYLSYKQFQSDNPAIVFAKQVNVQTEPNDRSDVSFTLHEGTKVNVLDSLDQFRKVRLSDGKTGWLPAKEIKLLKDF